MSDVKSMIGKTFINVSINDDRDRVEFQMANGAKYIMYHSQDCCESVSLHDIEGDLAALEGSPILQAEESSNSKDKSLFTPADYDPESFTWTFYRFATAKGWAVMRWLGTSNGYYSESVECHYSERNS